MSYCPVPPKASRTRPSTKKIKSTPKTPKFEICGGGTTTIIGGPGANIETTVCCPSPGPTGPAGCSLRWESEWDSAKTYNYESGTPCVTSLVTHNGVTYICKVTHDASETPTEPGVGESWTDKWDIFMQSGTGELRWVGSWVTGHEYKKNDVIIGPTTGHAFVCIQDHTSDANSPFAMEPPSPSPMVQPGMLDSLLGNGNTNPTTAGGTSLYWEAMVDFGKWSSADQQGFVDGLMNGVMDWWKDAPLWQKVLGVAAGLGLAYAGAKVLDSMFKDGKPSGGSGEADSRYNGTAGYNGAFTAPTLPNVVTSIMLFAGYTVDQIDVSLLPNTEVHFVVADRMSTRDLLNNLALTYQFDVVPSGGTVKFVPKYQAPIRALTAADLGFSTDDTGVAPYTAKRFQGIDLPRSVTFNYISRSLDYNTFTQVAEMYTYEDGQDVSLSVPFTLSDEEAMRIAQTALVNAHIEQQEFVFTTDYHNIDLEPGDVITIPVGTNADIAQVRIKQINETEDGLLEFKVSRADYNTQSYTSSGVAVATAPPQPSNVPSYVGYSDTLFIEAPAIDASDANPRLIGIVTGFGQAGWPGATVYRSVDGGNTYQSVASTQAVTSWGMVTNPTPAPTNGYFVWDDTTQISVTLKEGTLNTLSDIAVLNGQNWAMVGEELIGFVNATLTGPKTYTLSRLMRGRKGTEVKCGSHLANELFVLLDGAPIEIDVPKDELRRIVKYKTVTIGSSIDKVDAQDVQPFGLNMVPYKPGQAKMVKTGDTYAITWVERPRLNNTLQDERELVHDTDWAGFGVTIFGDSNMNTVKRSAVVMTPEFAYTKEMQVADFGAPQTQLYASIVQISGVIGGGYPAIVTI